MDYGFVRVAAITPSIRLADAAYNAEEIVKYCNLAAESGVQVACFPEMSVVGYTVGDLMLQTALLDATERAVGFVCERTKDLALTVVVGAPVRAFTKLFDCAIVINRGRVVAIVPKTNIADYAENAEARYFTDGSDFAGEVLYAGSVAQFGVKQIFCVDGNRDACFAVEIGEDFYVPKSPSVDAAAAGANIILNPTAGCEIVGRREFRETAVLAQSGRLCAGYVMASAGEGESTTDTVFAGHNLIAENGVTLARSELFTVGLTVAEIDAERLANERRKKNTLRYCGGYTVHTLDCAKKDERLMRKINQHPFLPEKKDEDERLELILNIQAHGLKKRLISAYAKTAVLGISGGLDSTLALLVTVRAFDLLKRDRSEILCITMPGFGTTGRTYDNSLALMQGVGATHRTVSVVPSVLQHFADIGHDAAQHDVTYENAQARMRTMILMDSANKAGGIVVGTGDLSEMALGWATYNGDHMSMYGVNCSIPKTLVKKLVEHEAKRIGGAVGEVLYDVLATEISPELLPPDAQGKIAQKTEDLVGPYELHDFYLYYAIRWGFSPKKVYYLAKNAFAEKYDEKTLVKWLRNFYRRFIAQQFKRSCVPDGVKVGSVTLSPRGDWKMPSDAVAAVWLAETDELDALL